MLAADLPSAEEHARAQNGAIVAHNTPIVALRSVCDSIPHMIQMLAD
jgi:hypothetical protein